MTSSNPVNIKLTRDDNSNPCTFEYNHSHKSANVGFYLSATKNAVEFVDGVATYTHPAKDNPVQLDATSAVFEYVVFQNNYGGDVFKAGGPTSNVMGYSTLIFTDSHFENNGAYGIKTDWSAWNMYSYLLDNNCNASFCITAHANFIQTSNFELSSPLTCETFISFAT